MKVTSVEIDSLLIPMDHPFAPFSSVSVALVTAKTDEGLQGYGHAMALAPRHFASMSAAIHELSELLIGEDPREPERIYRKMSPGGTWSGSGGIPTQATAALDIAVWDLAGKAAGLPLYRLLGGYRNHVPTYVTTRLGRDIPLQKLPETAASLVQEGFRAIKMNVGGQPTVEEEVQRVRAVRQAIGNDIELMADANSMWTPAQAIRVGHEIEEFQLRWLEDPVPIHNLEGLSEICQALDTPIATGEVLFGFTSFRPLFEARAVDVPMPDLLRVGGITPFRKAAAMAEAFGLPVANHLMHEVSAHLVAAVPNGLTVEYVPWSSKAFHHCPELKDGELVLSERPGHGLEPDTDFINKHSRATR